MIPLKVTNDTTIQCPHCGSEYLHLVETSAFDRSEDAKTARKVTITSSSVEVGTTSDLEGNPSIRRDGLAIRFLCEHCAKSSTMGLAQHKGTTEIGWM